MKDYYFILRIPRNATQDAIKAAWIEKSKELHPDRNPSGAEELLRVNEAYETLKDPRKRRVYDLQAKVVQFGEGGAFGPIVSPDGSVDLLKAAQPFVPAQLFQGIAPVAERLLGDHGIDAKGATLVQVLEAFGMLKKKRKVKRA